MFFCNSGAEANEGLFKLARKFGHDEGRFEILTAINSFHGRTLAGIAATGQEKVKKGFEPMMPGFRHVPYNDLAAVRAAISPATVAILIEGIQGEGGLTTATPGISARPAQVVRRKEMLLLMDGVQGGYFRTGRFQSFQRILEDMPGRANTFRARRHFDGEIARRRFPDRRVLGARALRRPARARHACFDIWRHAARLRGGVENSGGRPRRKNSPTTPATMGEFLKAGLQALAQEISAASSTTCAAWA